MLSDICVKQQNKIRKIFKNYQNFMKLNPKSKIAKFLQKILFLNYFSLSCTKKIDSLYMNRFKEERLKNISEKILQKLQNKLFFFQLMISPMTLDGKVVRK